MRIEEDTVLVYLNDACELYLQACAGTWEFRIWRSVDSKEDLGMLQHTFGIWTWSHEICAGSMAETIPKMTMGPYGTMVNKTHPRLTIPGAGPWPNLWGRPSHNWWGRIAGFFFQIWLWNHVAVCQNLVPLVNIKIAGKWMFIPLKKVLIGIDPYPC